MNVQMKPSRYNRIVHVPETDRHLLFNGVTTALISLDRERFEKARDLLAADTSEPGEEMDEETRELYDTLVDGRFIIPRSVDELALLRVRYNVSRFNNPLSLTILPTLACNLACTYCYERPSRDVMSQDTADAICAFVEDHARRERMSSFNVTWYGGEPLLAASTIWELSERFLRLSEQYNFRYSAAITTNGTLLTTDVVDNLLRYNVSAAQVTVDGPKRIHDARRPFKNQNRSSFDTILGNLDNVVGKMDMSLRINTDRRNAPFTEELLQVFADRGWLGSDTRFFPYMAPVSKLTEACADIVQECCTAESYLEHSISFCKACARYGVPIKTRALYHYPVAVKYNCGAIALNSMVIAPSGAIHKCSLTVNDETESLGNIHEPLDLVNPNLLKWLNFDPFVFDACRECDLLPICLGACPKRALEGEVPAETTACAHTKGEIDTILTLHAVS